MLRRGTLLPRSVAVYWRESRIWDRWDVETNEIPNRQVHIRQRLLTIEEVRTLDAQNLRVLDLCCGTGRTTYDLLNLPNVKEVVAVDINSKALDILRNRLADHPNIRSLMVVQADLMSENSLARLGSFEVVVCLDALHHLWNLPLALALIHDWLSQDGLLIGNCLARESVATHVGAKRGKVQFHFRYARAKFFVALGFINRLWEYSGKKGYVHMALFKRQEITRILEERFTVVKMLSDDYHWFVARQRVGCANAIPSLTRARVCTGLRNI